MKQKRHGGDMIDETEIQFAARRIGMAARQPARVILFGSHARGSADKDSDVDLLVVEEHFDDKAAEYLRLREAMGTLPAGVDLLLLSRHDFDRRSQVKGTLAYRAKQEGRVLYDTAA